MISEEKLDVKKFIGQIMKLKSIEVANGLLDVQNSSVKR